MLKRTFCITILTLGLCTTGVLAQAEDAASWKSERPNNGERSASGDRISSTERPPEKSRVFPGMDPNADERQMKPRGMGDELGGLLSPQPLGGGTSETLQMPEIVQFAAAEFPDLHQRLEKGRGTMPMQEVQEVVLFLKRMQDLKEDNPAMYEVEKSIHQLEIETTAQATIIRKASAKDTTKQRETLKTKLGELFDLREKKRELEARQIEAELKNVRDILAKRQTNREVIIQKRLKELTGDNEGQEW
jgi:hypothetical protein